MEHISYEKYSSLLDISKRYELFRKPFKKFISSFTSFYRLEILDIICYDEFWAMVTMSHSSSGLIHRNHGNTSLRPQKYNGRGVEFITIISKWSEIFFEKLIIENFFLEVSHIEFCLSLSLSYNNNELILMFPKNTPNRECCIDYSRLS